MIREFIPFSLVAQLFMAGFDKYSGISIFIVVVDPLYYDGNHGAAYGCSPEH